MIEKLQARKQGNHLSPSRRINLQDAARLQLCCFGGATISKHAINTIHRTELTLKQARNLEDALVLWLWRNCGLLTERLTWVVSRDASASKKELIKIHIGRKENRFRWMPDGDEDISWPWIKEALPSINLTKVLILSFCPFHLCTHIYPFCPVCHSLLRWACAGYLSDCWDPLHPNAIPVQPSFIGYL